MAQAKKSKSSKTKKVETKLSQPAPAKVETKPKQSPHDALSSLEYPYGNVYTRIRETVGDDLKTIRDRVYDEHCSSQQKNNRLVLSVLFCLSLPSVGLR